MFEILNFTVFILRVYIYIYWVNAYVTFHLRIANRLVTGSRFRGGSYTFRTAQNPKLFTGENSKKNFSKSSPHYIRAREYHRKRFNSLHIYISRKNTQFRRAVSLF